MIIYKLTSPNGRIYIGKTSYDLEKRFSEHVRDMHRYDYDLQFELRRTNIDEWEKEILEQTDDKERESYYIAKYDTYKNGLNMTLGGDGMDPQTASILKTKYWKSEKGLARRKKMSSLFKVINPSKKGRSAWNKGKKGWIVHTEETKQKISAKVKLHASERLKKAWANGKMDHRKNAETAEEMKARGCTMAGKTQTENQKKLVSEALSKSWLITHPNGRTETIVNLREFCRQHSLDYGNIIRAKSKGFKAKKIG